MCVRLNTVLIVMITKTSILNIKIENNAITQAKQTKYLGVIMDEDLKAVNHPANSSGLQ